MIGNIYPLHESPEHFVEIRHRESLLEQDGVDILKLHVLDDFLSEDALFKPDIDDVEAAALQIDVQVAFETKKRLKLQERFLDRACRRRMPHAVNRDFLAAHGEFAKKRVDGIVQIQIKSRFFSRVGYLAHVILQNRGCILCRSQRIRSFHRRPESGRWRL